MIVVLSTLLSICISSFVMASQQHVRLTTKSANFDLSITFEQGQTFSINELFRFESATSKLFHAELSADAGSNAVHAMPDVILASVHVERMMNTKSSSAAKLNDGMGLTLKSVVSVTFSDVGLYNSLEVVPIDGGLEVNTAPDVASLLTQSVSSGDILKVLTAEGLVAIDTTVLDLSFTEFDSSSSKRGVTATETDIVSSDVNDGWPMFFAGVMITLLLLGIATVGAWVYNKEFPSSKKTGDDDSCNSVHFKGDVNLDDVLEVATSASGILGGKGHHPKAENDENAHPNSSAYRRNRRVFFSSSHPDMDADASADIFPVSPSPSKHPLGITKLEKVLTPRRPKKHNDRTPMYDIEKLSRA